MTDLNGKTILITGASRGLGRATALAAAQAGAQVIATARTQGALEDLDDQIRQSGGQCTLLPLDLLKGEEIDRLGPSIYHRFGRLDALIHAAGELGPLTPTHQLKPNDLERLMRLMAFASHRLIITCDPLLRAAPQGRAIFIDDVLAQTSQPFWTGYQAAKAAMRAIVENYGLETTKTSVTVELVTPTPMQTVLRRKAFPGEVDDAQPHPAQEAQQLIEHLWQPTATQQLPSTAASA